MNKLYSLRFYAIILLLLVTATANISWSFKHEGNRNINLKLFKTYNPAASSAGHNINKTALVYDSLSLAMRGLSKQAFDYAVKGLEELNEEGIVTNDSILTIVDFDQPSYQKRMFVLDVKNFKVLFNTWAAHGKNSGREMAQSFSNINESNKSSLGFYVTGDTYSGSKGFSLRLSGLEKNLNDHAYQRAIVLHGASYVSQKFINSMGFIGRSHGCPAVPVELNKPIINTIKNGSCLFIYNSAYKPTLAMNI